MYLKTATFLNKRLQTFCYYNKSRVLPAGIDDKLFNIDKKDLMMSHLTWCDVTDAAAAAAPSESPPAGHHFNPFNAVPIRGAPFYLLNEWTEFNVLLEALYSTDYVFQHSTQQLLAVWLSGNALASINVVALRQTRLVSGWVTVCGWVYHLGM